MKNFDKTLLLEKFIIVDRYKYSKVIMQFSPNRGIRKKQLYKIKRIQRSEGEIYVHVKIKKKAEHSLRLFFEETHSVIQNI